MDCRIKTQRLPKQTTQDSKTGYGLSWNLSQTYFTLWENFSYEVGRKEMGKLSCSRITCGRGISIPCVFGGTWLQITTDTKIRAR